MAETKIEQILDEVESKTNKIYQQIIKLHNDQRLRKFTKDYGDLEVYRPSSDNKYMFVQDDPETRLVYASKGFVYISARRVSVSGDESVYTDPYLLKEKNGKLIASGYNIHEEYDLFGLCPKITLKKIESGLEIAIKEKSGVK